MIQAIEANQVEDRVPYDRRNSSSAQLAAAVIASLNSNSLIASVAAGHASK